MADPVRLAELVCARFSHDISGLLGSLTGVLELAAEIPGAAVEEIALASETALALMDRLRLLRAAWGEVAEPLEIEQLRALAGGLAGVRKLTLDLAGVVEGPALPPPMARLVLNVLLLAGEALPRGGKITLSGNPENLLVAQVAGPGAAWPAGFAAYVAHEAEAWACLDSPRTLQGPLTVLFARAAGMRLSLLIPPRPPADGAPPPLLVAPMAN